MSKRRENQYLRSVLDNFFFYNIDVYINKFILSEIPSIANKHEKQFMK